MSAYDVAISDGSTTLKFIVDRSGESIRSGGFSAETIPTLRPQQDTSANPSEQSINPESGWLRSIETWHHGAGQTFADRSESDRARFRASKGVNPWTKWQLTLLNDTKHIRTGDLQDLASAGGTLYYSDFSQIYASSNPLAATPTWTLCTGTGITALKRLATDGAYVYVMSTTGVLYRATAGSTAFSSYATGGSGDFVAYVKGRLMVSGAAGVVYNVTGSGAFPTPLAQLSMSPVDFCEGPNRIYLAGNIATDAGSEGIVYKIGIRSDGTGLDAPVPASPGMPRGELIYSIGNYLGFIFIATSKGIRMCDADANGDLTIGPPIVLNNASGAQAFFGDDRFVYFSWPGYDATSWGLGRMDLQSFTDTLLPAYASDLMSPITTTVGIGAAGSIPAITKFNDSLVWGVFNGFGATTNGLWAEDTSQKVASGYVDSGYITYNISDPKTPQAVDTRHLPLPAGSSIVTALNVEDAGFTTVSTLHADSDPTRVALTGYGHSEHVELRATLNRATSVTAGPTLTRETLLSEVIVQSGMYLWVPVILSEADAQRGGYTKSRNFLRDFNQLYTWRNNRTPLTVTIGTEASAVVLRDFRRSNNHKSHDGNEQNTVMLQFKTAA